MNTLSFFLAGLILGIELRVPIINRCLKMCNRRNKKINALALENAFYKKKAGYDINEPTPNELNEILKKYNLENVK